VTQQSNDDGHVVVEFPSTRNLRHEFLRVLHPHGYRDLRAFRQGEAPKTFSFAADNLAGVDEFADLYHDRDVFVGVAPRIDAKHRDTDGCLALYAVWVDFDFKHFSDDDAEAEIEIRRRIAAFPFPPSIIVRSGGGLHCYWLLDEPFDLQNGGAALAKQILRALATALDGDLAAAEVARILRLPGTLNHKYTPPRPVVVEVLNNRRYSMVAIREVLPPIAETAPEPLPPVEHDLSIKERMRLAGLALRYQPAGYQQGYRPDDPDQNGDHETFRVCAIAAHDFDLPFEDAYTVLQAWNARCRPPWPPALLRDKLQGAIKYAKGARGARLDFHYDIKGKDEKAKKVIRKDEPNILLALTKLHVDGRWDSFALKLFVTRNGQPPRLFDDAIEIPLRYEIAGRFGLELTSQKMGEVLKAQAWRQSYHPVREYLSGLRWDEKPRLDNWLTTYGGAPATPFVHAVGAITLIAAVRRVRVPGCKFDELLILEAKQGLNKSLALRALCPNDNWFSDDLPLGADAKEIIERTAGMWLIEASEMFGSDREADRLKSMLSRQRDGPVRLAYDRNSTEVPRQFIVIGTTNRKFYLKDPTGGRRFWPVPIAKFDLALLAADRDQLWAEAAVREARGESIRLQESLYSAAAVEQEARHREDPWEEIIVGQVLEPKNYSDYILAADIWSAIGSAAYSRNSKDADRVANIMQRRGYSRKQRCRPNLGDKQLTHWIKDGVVLPGELPDART
jgi:hypothetical protein